ncbi:MAG: hypothetical protein JEY99_16595 [Spirochaetales bacterium]|nr:hypothetical protein [Spirochaetales bacterium]
MKHLHPRVHLILMLFIMLSVINLHAQEADLSNMRIELSQAIARKTGISSGPLFSAVQIVPRHDFLSEDRKGTAYEDRTIPLGRGRFLPSPSDIILMLDFCSITPDENILILGDSIGYTVGLLQNLSRNITVVEMNPEELDSIREYFNREIEINLPSGPVSENKSIEVLSIEEIYNLYDKNPFDLIIIQGSLNEIPQLFFGILNSSGSIITSLTGESGFSILFKYEKNGSGGRILTGKEVYFPFIAKWP